MPTVRRVPLPPRRRWALPAVLALLAALGGCAGLPARPALPEQQALPPTTRGTLHAQVQPLVAAHPGVTGVVPLDNGLDAFAARVWLVEQAERSLDLQSYIWRDDRTGRWLLARVAAAADRGVRVRLLLDDNNGSPELDALLARLDAHPLAEVRLFNPYRWRGAGRLLHLAADFGRLNRRMHNKSFSADGQATILGGRNVGDEYFGAAADMQFADLDVLVVGPVVHGVSAAFDLYWNHALAFPLAALVKPGGGGAPSDAERASAERSADEAARYAGQLTGAAQLERWRRRGPAPDDYHWGRAQLVLDPPSKLLERAQTEELLLPKLMETIGDAERSIDLVSPYFVPGDEGVEAMAALVDKGVRLRVLTNSLAATDVAAVHAGYAGHRLALLDAGVELYELKPQQQPRRGRTRLLGRGSSREASLHAKTFAIDGERIFIGSANFDPRSAWLNSEIGLLMEHPGLARRIAGAFDAEVPRQSWRLSSEAGQLRWTEQTTHGPRTLHEEPQVGALLQLWVRFLSLLPIESLL